MEVEETEGEEMIPGGMSDLTIPEYDPHDPMCPSMDESESEYCSLCHCHLIARVREQAIRDCIQILESTAGFNEYSWGLEAADADETGQYVDSYEVLEKLSALLEKP